MSDLSNINWYSMSDNAIVKHLAGFVRQARLRKNYTQNELAQKAGIHRITLGEFENGERSISLLTFIELLRALNELDLLDAIKKTEPVISPLHAAKLEAQQRKRASRTPARTFAAKKKQSAKKKK